MNHIGQKISATRKEKGFSQEELAELSKMNLRTIQRIENNQSEPRGKTLQLICDALELDLKELQIEHQKFSEVSTLNRIINFIFYVILNLILVFLINLLTIDSEANLNSRIGALFLSFFLPYFIVYQTSKMIPSERLFKFGTGYIFNIVLLYSIHGIVEGMVIGITSGLLFCMLFSLAIFFYGNKFLKTSIE